MSEINMTSLIDKLQDLDLCLTSQDSKEHSYGRALREAILCMDLSMEVEVLKSLGELHLEKGKRSKDSSEFDKAAALYAAALLRCTDSDMGETLEHRIGYMEKLTMQLLQGYTTQFRWLSPDYWGTADSNVLRVAEKCDKLDRSNKKSQHSVEETYTESLVTAIENGDIFFEVEILKSLGDFYLEQGKTNYDVSQFSKSTAMYEKALTRCEDPETKQTLHHRVSYAEKIMEAVRRKSITTKPMQIGRRPSMSPLSQYKDHLKKGESSLTRGVLDSAEQHFAAALKTVHIPDPTAQRYQREVEPLCKLGDVYSKRGQQTRDGGDFVKAAALYNAAIARSEDQLLNGNITTDIKEVGKSFLKCILDIHCNVSEENTENHKKQLKEMRDQIKLEMETIDQQLDPYVHDEDDPCVKGIEAKRAQAVRQLFENITQQRKEFISLLVEECIGLMGPPPCKYAHMP
ncbi:Hypp4080 [Branchiostoma lanceolatum]|uniref:Hypp4080 protein n=1 Tax=Branchiostoma lanceolatum TaxID=7740 RepID=A0A8K0A4E4_BRALA|nr:Hypp4080 [Branchiostoma lanceolatum]